MVCRHGSWQLQSAVFASGILPSEPIVSPSHGVECWKQMRLMGPSAIMTNITTSAMGRFPQHGPMVLAVLDTNRTAASTAAVSVPGGRSVWRRG
jgi:hypothetical protein